MATLLFTPRTTIDANIFQYCKNEKREVILETNTWYDWAFYEIKIFKKGTLHLKFKDLNDWYVLNQAYGKLKGFSLPEEYKK